MNLFSLYFTLIFQPQLFVCSRSKGTDETDFAHNVEPDLFQLLERIFEEPGHITMLSGKELEVLAEMDPDDVTQTFGSKRLDRSFLEMIQGAADRHLMEKTEIRDALGLLKLYHKANFLDKSSLCETSSTSNGKNAKSESAFDVTNKANCELEHQREQSIDESSTDILKTSQRKRRKIQK